MLVKFNRLSYRLKKKAHPAEAGSFSQDVVQYGANVGSIKFLENIYYI